MAFTLLSGHEGMYTEERLKPLRSYKYQGVDKSFISRYILSHYWNWVVTLVPLWMAWAGSIVDLFLVSGIVYFAYQCSFAFCLWMYSTLDNIDGKQARRTGSSSPLGELFDHGCDALNCSLGGLVQVAAMGLGSSVYAVLALGITFWAFYLPTWEEYHTGVLYLGYINGPTEGLLCAMALMFLSGIFGPQMWTQTFGNQFPNSFTNTRLQGFPISHAAIVFFFSIFSFVYVPTCIVSVYRTCQKSRKSFSEAIAQLLPMFLISVAATSWLYSPYSLVLKNHFILFWLSFGIGFGKMATKIIYAHLTKRRFPFHSGLMLPLFSGSILINLPLVLPIKPVLTAELEEVYLWLWFSIAIIGYLNWSYHLINSFCQYLDINCFSLGPRPSMAKKGGRRKND